MTNLRSCTRLSYRLIVCHLLAHYEVFSENKENYPTKPNSITGNMQKTFNEG